MSVLPDPASLPCSPLDETAGLKYFPRMLGKIRLHEAGLLWEELKENLGKGSDAKCASFLHVAYDDLKARVLAGGSDEEVLRWCQEKGRPLNGTDLLVWNAYYSKLGWNDLTTPTLEQRKIASGLAGRDDIETMGHYIDVDEGRRP